MDELDALRAFRAEMPDPPATAQAAARARIATTQRRPRRARRAMLVTAAAVATAGATVAIVSGLDEGHVAPAPATAREALRQAADVAEQRSRPGVPRDDQFFYVASEGTELVSSFPTRHPKDSFSYLYTKRREVWLSVDRSGLLSEEQVGPPRWVTPRDRENWIKAGRQGATAEHGPRQEPMDAIHQYYIGDERFTTAQLLAFDPTPQQLFDRLRSRVGDRGQSRDGEVFVEIADALREAPQTPRLRATLYRALALVPGVQLLGELRDRLGREAIGVAFTEHTGLRQELLFDPQTAEILNERQVVAHPVQGLRAAPGTVIEDIVYTKRAVTDATTRP
jgi:hypothetical protein